MMNKPPKPMPPLTNVALAQKFHKESEVLRAEAQDTLKECRETLGKIQRFNDQANINQRRIALAVSSLLPKSLRNEFNLNASDIENTTEISRKNVVAIEQREIFDIVHAINVLAIANTDVLHVFSRFSGHVNEFHVRVCSTDSDYIDSRPECIFNESIYLEQEDALEKLLAIESQLTELIIEAREQTEAKAEVNA
ncbi:hypothetical protein [Vibrio fluvialis]|uniref:hypothetical protein n=1 Tax=Vibrio fluvialis TaxID=676 RepID=UPI001EE9D6BF|nr:hypothetical protein [Vibrio fluvialis]MCG6412648.1 hypothetical protein [Vibrio fluvialis]